MTLAQRLLDQCSALEAQRQPHESIWDDLGQICFPRHGALSQTRHQVQVTGATERGRIAQNFDGTAMRACDTLAQGQSSRITPMGARWFVLRPPALLKDSQEALNWYAKCSEILQAYLGTSNFYNRAFQCYQFRGGHGIAAMECTAGAKGKGLHFRVLPTGTYAIAENSLDEVDVVFRRFNLTPAQCLQMFPDSCPEDVRKKFEDPASRYQSTETVVHALFPRDDRDPRKADDKSKPIASVHVLATTATLLSESGFDSMPVAVSRWATDARSPYGWGPGDYALPEAAQANFQEQMLDVLAETAAFPRVLYPAGMKDEIDFAAMGLTSFDPNAGENAAPREWLTGGRYDIGKDRANDKRRAIEASFFVDLFTAVSRLSSDATATQVSAIVSESRELFHPIFSSMVREWTTPTLRRAWQLLMQQGVMPPPPPAVIQADDLSAFIAEPDVEYVSAMALALEQGHLSKLNNIIAVITPLAAADPAWLRPLNPDTIVPHLVRAEGLPTDFLRTPSQMEALLAQEQAAQQVAAAQAASQSVRNLGGVDETAKAAEMLQAS